MECVREKDSHFIPKIEKETHKEYTSISLTNGIFKWIEMAKSFFGDKMKTNQISLTNDNIVSTAIYLFGINIFT